MTAVPALRACRRGITVALFVVAATATASLPRELLGLEWMLALIVPAALFGVLRQPPRRPFVRAAFAVATQVAAIWLAHDHAGPLQRPAVLAGSILPPLAFVVARRTDGDATLGLFLAFCVLLVGSILHQPEPLLVLPFVLAAVLQLRCEARRHALLAAAARHVGPTPGAARAPWLQGVGLGIVCGVAMLAVDRLLLSWPRPDDAPRQHGAPSPDQRPTIGLPDDFVLDGGGDLLDLQGDVLVEVHALDRRPVPRGLYLRSGHFEVPGLDGWRIGRLQAEPRNTGEREWQLHRPLPRLPLRRLEIRRHAGARNFVFVPPGLCSISGMQGLYGDPQREWFRLPPLAMEDIYEVAFQELDRPPADLPVPPRWQGLLALPPGIHEDDFRPFLQGIDVRRDALAIADAVAAALQQHCRYERREPSGPYPHALLNFLHGDRVGFCMHFASAAAILLRMAGVPCRIGVGLYGGEPGARPGTRHYGSQHAHAWVEIPITGRGFVVFDPTPPAERGVRGELAAAQPEAAAPEDEVDDGITAAAALAFAERQFRSPWPWLLLLLLFAFVTHGGVPRRDAATAAQHAVARPARRLLLKILRELAGAGHVRNRAETLECYAARLRQLGAAAPDLLAAFAAYQEVRFGGRAFDALRHRAMAAGLDAARTLPRRDAPDARAGAT